MPRRRELPLPPRRAIRPTGPVPPAVFTPAVVDDDIPARDELIEAIWHLRKESDIAALAIGAARSRSTYEKAWKRWDELADHLENMCAGVMAFDQLLAAADNA